MVALDHRDARPLYLQVKDSLRRMMLTGLLTPGEKLPSVRALATQLAINPNTIQRAYRELEVEGYLATVPGKGCFVCGRPGSCLPEKQVLLETFDTTTDALLRLGMTREELAARLVSGGDNHA